MDMSMVMSLLPLAIIICVVVWLVVRARKKAAIGPLLTPQLAPAQTIEYRGPFAFFRKHFNGDYSLGRSYWVNTTLIALFAPTLGFLMLPWFSENLEARYTSIAFLLVTLFGVVSWTWAVSGTWASANKHVGRGGKQSWASAAKVMIVIGFLRTFGEIGNLGPDISEHFRVAMGDQPGPATKVEILADGKSIRLSGGINDGTAEQLSKALEMAPSVNTLILASNGGWIRQGALLAKLIEARGLSTYVEAECVSACTIAFLAGKDRAADPSARIGFHSVKMVGGGTRDLKNVEEEATVGAYQKANLPRDFVERIAATPSSQMWYPTYAEMAAAGVLTRRSLGGEVASMASRVRSRDSLDTEFRRAPIYQSIAQKYPDIYKRILDSAWLKIEQGKSDGEMQAAVRAEITQMSGKLMPLATDETLIAYVALLNDQVVAVSKVDTGVCVEMLFPTGRAMNLMGLLPKELAERELELTYKVVTEADAARGIKPKKGELEALVPKLVKNLTQEELDGFVSKEKRDSDPAAACRAATKYFAALNSLPLSTRGRSIRLVFGG